MSRRAVSVLVLAATLSTIPALRAGAVTGGTADNLDHPYVGALLPAGATSPVCSVVLVRNDAGAVLGLTDAHCLYRAGRRNGTGATATFASSWTATSPAYHASWYVDPAYNPVTHAHDYGALVFSATPAVGPAVLAGAAASASVVGGSVTTVGTGSPYLGQRREATETVRGYDATWLYLTPGNGNSCGGDSGGPDLLEGTSAVVALTDQGSCSQDQDIRTDTAAAHAFADAAATWPHLAPRLGLALSTRIVRAGSTLTATGVTSALYSGERVLRQGYYGGAWHTWASAVVSATGRYAFTIRPTVVTTDYYRIYLPATATHPSGHSATVSLRVTG